ncbi:unnamed protein product, partial [marine sediment metagenome]
MLEVDRCPECKVPEPFSQGQTWLNNGDIVQPVNHEIRMSFIECENLDPLFKNIGDIIGMPVERFVINIAARSTKRYMSSVIPEEVKEKLQTIPHRHRDGDLELERCPTYGVPAALSGFRWYLDRGLIVNKHTRRRMAMLGPELLDGLFRALEAELGEAIPNAVVEAQRRFTKTGFYSIEEVSDEGDFRTQLALRGMGNLKDIQIGR